MAYWIVFTSLRPTNKSSTPSDALAFIFIPIQDLMTLNLREMIRLEYLEILEILYTQMVKGAEDSRWQSLLVFSFGFQDMSPLEKWCSIMEVKQQVSSLVIHIRGVLSL